MSNPYDYDAATLGQELYTWQMGGGDIQDYFVDFLHDQGWLDDAWTQNAWTWWSEYGSFLENLEDTWDQESFDLIGDLRDVEIEEFNLGFLPTEESMGATGFAQAANIGTMSDMGGTGDFVADYNAGLQPINTRFERSREDAWSAYGQNYLDMFASLMTQGAFSEDP